VGRAEDCQVLLDDARISRHHAVLEVSGRRVKVRDLGSRNGLFVNGARTQEATLAPGDRVAFGPLEFLLAETPEQEAGAAVTEEGGPIRERGHLVDDALPTDSRRLQTLYRVAEELVANLRLGELLPRILDSLAQLFRYDRCAVIRREPDGSLTPWVTRPEGLVTSFSRSVAERVVNSGETLLFDDIQGQASFDLGESVAGLHIRSVLCSPLVLRGEVLGLVYLDRSVPGAYGPEDLALLRSVGALIAIAMENARLYAEVEGRYEQTAGRLRALEARLIETERAAALGQLALTVADEVRNPVTVIGGLARRLRKEAEGQALAAAVTIQDEAERLERMMGRVEALVNLPLPVVGVADVEATVAQALAEVRPLLDRAGVTLRTQRSTGGPRAPHDPALTRAALTAVLEHACRYLSPGAALHLSVRGPADRCWIAVEDERCAEQPPPLTGAFESGSSGEPWSLDLGLALAERAMVAQGGDLRLGGHAGSGICAYLILPGSGEAPGARRP
jgi:GAF domain-containing protein